MPKKYGTHFTCFILPGSCRRLANAALSLSSAQAVSPAFFLRAYLLSPRRLALSPRRIALSLYYVRIAFGHRLRRPLPRCLVSCSFTLSIMRDVISPSLYMDFCIARLHRFLPFLLFALFFCNTLFAHEMVIRNIVEESTCSDRPKPSM